MNQQTVGKNDNQSLRSWLLSETPTSRNHARISSFYQGWLTLKSNKLTMIGMAILLSLLLVAVFYQQAGHPVSDM